LKRKSILTLFVALLFSMLMISIVHGNPGISTTIIPVKPYITSPSGTATYIVNVTSITTQDENLSLTVSGDAHLGFNWTAKDVILPKGTTELFGLGVTNPGGGSGELNFTASAEAWPTGMTHDQAVAMGLIETSTYLEYVHIGAVPALTVSISPTSWTLDAGQSKTFTANVSGGISPYLIRWYLDGVLNSAATNSTSYSFTFSSAGANTVNVTVTDSVGDFAFATASVTVHAALVAPTVTASPSTVDQSQTSSLTSSSVTTGTSPYTYQWFEKAPGGNYATASSNSPSFSFVTSGTTATGSWSFILQVTDHTGVAVNSSAATVEVNTLPPPSVGGVSASANALSSLAPWLGIVTLLAAAMLLKEVIVKKKMK